MGRERGRGAASWAHAPERGWAGQRKAEPARRGGPAWARHPLGEFFVPFSFPLPPPEWQVAAPQGGGKLPGALLGPSLPVLGLQPCPPRPLDTSAPPLVAPLPPGWPGPHLGALRPSAPPSLAVTPCSCHSGLRKPGPCLLEWDSPSLCPGPAGSSPRRQLRDQPRDMAVERGPRLPARSPCVVLAAPRGPPAAPRAHKGSRGPAGPEAAAQGGVSGSPLLQAAGPGCTAWSPSRGDRVSRKPPGPPARL